MQRPRIGRFVVGLFGIAIVACGPTGSSGSSDSGFSSTADSGADDGSRGSGAGLEAGALCDGSAITDGGRRCSLAMPVQGGLTGTLNGDVGCGDASGPGPFLAWTSGSPSARVTASFQGGLPKLDGMYPLTSLNIKVTGADGGSQSWTAPAGACTITVSMEDIECQTAFGRLLKIVYGSGTCTQPAMPDTGNPAGPITIGDFQFEHWL